MQQNNKKQPMQKICKNCGWYEERVGYCKMLNHCMGLDEYCSRWIEQFQSQLKED